MGVFKRMKDMSKAGVNEWLDQMEDPAVMINQYIRDMQAEINKAEVTVAKQMASERMLKQRLEEALSRSSACETKAAAALLSGEEELARRHLEEKLTQEERSKDLAALHTQSKVQAEELLRQLHEMKDEYYRMLSRRNELTQRVELARAKKRTAEVIQANTYRIDSGSALRGFHRMEEKIMQLEAEADVRRSMSGYSPVASYSQLGAAPLPADPLMQQRLEEELQQLRSKHTTPGA